MVDRLGTLRFIAVAVAIAAAADAAASGVVDLKILPENPRYPSRSECRAVDPPPFEKMPLSQGDTAICFAYAASAMISKRVGFEVSPLDIATTFFFGSPYELRSSKWKQVSDFIRTHPGRMQTLVWDQNQVDISPDENPGGRPYVDRLEGGEEDSAALLANLKDLCPNADLPSHEGFEQFRTQKSRMRFASLRKPNLCYRALAGSPRKVRDDIADNYNARWLKLVENRCRRVASPVPLLPVSYRFAQDQEEFLSMEITPSLRKKQAKILDMANYALDNNRHPVVGYSYYILQPRASDDPDRFADHSSAVIARKKEGNTCYYMVEDNSGETCFRFHPHIRERCVLGRVWLSEDELKGAVYSVIYLR